MKTLSALMMGAMCAVFMACEAGSSDEQEVDSEAQSVRDATNPYNSTYFTIRRDLRKCASPACGGYFVRRVNRALTVCADRVARPECFVAALDLSPLLLSPAAEADLRINPRLFLLRGRILESFSGSFGNLGLFRATEALRGHAGVRPAGTFYRVKDNGIVCITFPCLSLTAERLNSDLGPKAIAGVNLEGIGESSIDAQVQLRRPGGLLLAALPTTVTGPAGSALALNATEFYIPFTPSKDDGNQVCGSLGLKSCGPGEFCSFPEEANCGRADAPGVCRRRPEICPQVFMPVCGCDGSTYGNACQAASAGVSVFAPGPC